MNKPTTQQDDVSNLEWILSECDRIITKDYERQQVRALFESMAGQVLRFTFKVLLRPNRVQHARRLLDAGNDRPTVRDALRARYGCSTRHAYELIQDALNERGKDRMPGQKS